MLGDGRPRHLESSGNRPGRHLVLAHDLHDLKPGLVAQRLNLGEYRQVFRSLDFVYVRWNDIGAVYAQWSARGAEFLTPPIDRGGEIRCYMRDPDGHLIEVGQLVGRPDG